MDVISVIVPVYGVEKYIEKCINSILNSTYKNLEILVVNDGSKDCSKDIVFNIASSSLYEVVNDNISNKFDADKLNSIVRVNVNKFNEYSKDIYVKIPSTLRNSYFSYLDCLAQEIIYNEAILSNSSYFSIDELGNFEPCDNLNVNDLFDNAVFEIRAKSYSFSSGLSNIKYIEHFNNLGLYQARLTGYEYATGKYITSIDSDDYIGIDYIRMLWKTAEETDADVVISEMVRENSKAGYKSKRTHAMNAIHGLDLHGREIPDYLFESEGELSPLWFVWGKLYKKTLWDKCYPFLSSVSGHHIMLEDMMYGTVFSTNASHYVYCDVDTYFYVVNDNASTTNNGSSEKLKKNIDDVLYAFEFIENYIRKRGLYNRYKNSFKKFKEKWSRTWYDIQADYLLTNDEREEILEKLQKLTSEESFRFPDERDVFFYNPCTPWDNRIEMLKQKIVDKEVISFDIFDTLIKRPFWKPSDLFILLNDEYIKITSKKGISFSEMRITAEKVTRQNLNSVNCQLEDITLDEIYDNLGEIFGVQTEICNYMKKLEIETELKMCETRKKVKELYELAKWLGKRVIFISDMYLPRKVIEEILLQCGYEVDNSNLYLSSELRLTKTTGHLFEKAIDEEKIDASNFLHIGDNWKSDGEPAIKLGIEVWRTPKTIDLFMNNVADVNKSKVRGEYGNLLYKNLSGSFIRYTQALDYYGIRCMLAVIANKVFDNPYGDWEPYTDFNRNPYLIGYIALGMHEYGIVQWLKEQVSENKKIFFVARDGYLAMKAYEIFKNRDNSLPEFDYFYMSRKSFLPLSICNKEDWWLIKDNINYKGKTIEQLISYFGPILPEYGVDAYRKIFEESGLLYDIPLENEFQYVLFVKVIVEKLHNQELINNYRQRMKKILSNIFQPGDVMFDIGYSGRAQAILSKLLGYNIDACYIHTLNEKSNLLSKENSFRISTFYDYSPAITGKIRELVQSQPIPSCVGYEISNNELIPVFENSEWRFHEKYVINSMHRGAEDFLNDFLNIFSEYLNRMTYRRTDISFLNEKFILMPKKGDMEIFELFHFEDDLFFNKDYKEKWLIDIWNGDLEWNKLPHHVLKKRKKGEKNFKYADEKNEIITASLEKKDIHSNKNSVDVVPYRIPLDPPKGLFSKIIYFKNNDHILLKRYMEQKSGLENKLFEKTYGLFLDIKHKLKNQNSVGNLRSHYTLSKEGKILYNATSSYGLLCCIVHKLTFYPQDKADLMLSTWRSDKYEAVVRTRFFENVIKWSDMKYRSYSYAMDSYIRNATEMEKLEQEYRFFGVYEKLLTINIPDYKKIVVAGNSMPFGDFLERNEIAYSIIEDGAGLFCDYSLLQHFIDSTYPLIEQYMNKKYSNLYGGKFCEKIYINVKAQKKEYDDARTIDFAPVTLIDSLSNTNRKKILSIYGVDEASSINNKRVCLLLTYPLAQREKFTIDEEKQCYSLLADMFGDDCDEVHLKAHPDDRTDFSEIEGIKIINRNVLSELLWYETKTQYVKAIATVSTSMNNLFCVDKGIVFDVTFCKEYKNLLKYFIISKLINNYEKVINGTIKVCGIGVYHDMLNTLLKENCSRSEYSSEELSESNIIIGVNDDEINFVSGNQNIILLEKPKNNNSYKHILIRKKSIKNYDFVNMHTEDIYISKNMDIRLPISVELKVSGIKIQLVEDRYF